MKTQIDWEKYKNRVAELENEGLCTSDAQSVADVEFAGASTPRLRPSGASDGSMNSDLVYHKQGLFTAFIPQSKAGDDAWRELASQTEGTGKVFTAQLPATLSALRAAGYAVSKAKKPSKEEIYGLMAELERMGF